MTKITKEEILKIARMSHLEIQEHEIEPLRAQLESVLSYAERVQEVSDAVDSPRLRAWIAMNSEAHLYRGDWQAVVRIAESALPAAWEIREWVVVVWASAWLAAGMPIAIMKFARANTCLRNPSTAMAARAA